jgi:protocatechuate 3,4-dioxygenase, alpha subunit
VSVFARGLLDRVVTRIYLPDEAEANAADPVLASVDPARRPTLIALAPEDSKTAGADPAAATAEGAPPEFRFDIRLQGDRETVFFDL